MDDLPPLYTAPPAYGTPEMLIGHGAMVETKDSKGKTMLDGLWDL